MTSAEMARSYFRQAQRIFEEALHHQQAQAWHLVIRRCQETVELALKAVLRAAGVEVPHVHDVGLFLVDHAARFPETFTTHLDRTVSVSRRLREEREISFYGDEEIGAPAERLYTAGDAQDALCDARFILTICESHLPGPPAG
jgi:HEPN domain-containing protein